MALGTKVGGTRPRTTPTPQQQPTPTTTTTAEAPEVKPSRVTVALSAFAGAVAGFLSGWLA